ncbi:MAG: chloride channel protein [Fidelibacterota bacterium]
MIFSKTILRFITLFKQLGNFNVTRLVLFSGLMGVLGAVASLIFTHLVEFLNSFFLVGLAGYQIPKLATEGGDLTEKIGSHWRWLIPLVTTSGALISGWLVFRFAPETEGHGTDAVVKSYHQQGGRIRQRVPFLKLISAALTIGSGGSAGREGPTAQITAGLGSLIADWFSLDERERRLMILTGMAAGLSAMFRSPFGAAIFAIEILYHGMEFEARHLIYTIIAAVTAYAVNGIFFGWTPIFQIPSGLTFQRPGVLVWFVVLGIIAGMLGSILPRLFYRLRDGFNRIPVNPIFKPALGGLALGLLALAVPQVLGGGYGWMQLAINGELGFGLVCLLMVTKPLAMSFTISSGGSGGVFAPTLFIGTMIGVALAQGVDTVFPGVNLNIPSFAIVGMACLFGGAARVPIAALMMVVEMTGGYGLLVPTMITVALSYLVQSALRIDRKYPTLYEAQVADRSESPVHRQEYVNKTLQLLRSNNLRQLTKDKLISLSLQDIVKWPTPLEIKETGQFFLLGLVRRHSPLAGKRLKDTNISNADYRILAVIRDGDFQVPEGNTILYPGDKVILIIKKESYPQIKDSIRIPYLDRMK